VTSYILFMIKLLEASWIIVQMLDMYELIRHHVTALLDPHFDLT